MSFSLIYLPEKELSLNNIHLPKTVHRLYYSYGVFCQEKKPVYTAEKDAARFENTGS